MAISISSLTALNNDGVNSVAALARQGITQEFIAVAAKKTAPYDGGSNFSSVSLISFSGKARLSLESLQAQAESLQNANVPPTLSDFKVAVQGVVGSLNALGSTLANSLTEFRGRSSFAVRTQKFIDSIAPARGVGVESQGNNSFFINQKQLVSAFNQDSKGAFATLQDFTSKFIQTKDLQSLERPQQVGDAAKKEEMRRAEAFSRDRAASQAQANQNKQNQALPADIPKLGFSTQLSIQLGSASGFTAQAAVNSYLAVAEL